MVQQSAANPAIVSLYNALNVSGLTSLASVWNNVPQSTTYPYVLISLGSETRMDAMGRPGKSVLCEVHVFSQARGDKEALTILSKVVELLHYQALSVSAHGLVAVQYEQGFDAGTELVNTIPTRHHIGLFRVTVTQVP